MARNEPVAANFTTKRTLLRANKRREARGKDPIVQGEPRKGTLSNIQTLYAAGGILDTASIAIGTMSKASAIRATGKFEEAAFMENSRRLKLAADAAIKSGDKDAAKFMRRVRSLIGTQRAVLGASGIEIDRGSAADIQAETLEFGSEDASTIRTNAVMEAFGLERQAIEQESSARLTRIGRKAEERSVRRAGTLRVVRSAVDTSANISRAGSA